MLLVLLFLHCICSHCIFIEISKNSSYIINLAEIIIFDVNRHVIPASKFDFQLSSTDEVYYFPAKLCNNNDILDFCTTATNDSNPTLTIHVDDSVESIGYISVFNRPIELELRHRINDAVIAMYSDSRELLWEGKFGNTSSFKYIFTIDYARCINRTGNADLNSEAQLRDCFDNMPIAVDYENFSQLGQDEFAIEFFGEKRNGFFVDFGANDGVTLSNSYALEKNYGWKGIAVEPLPKHHKSLLATRNCTVLNVCASNRTGFTKFRVVQSNDIFAEAHGFDTDMLSGIVDTWVWQTSVNANEFTHRVVTLDVYCVLTQDIFDNFNVTHIDYMSVDAEGAELSILQGIDWTRMDITLIHVDFTRDEIEPFLQERGYKVLQHGHDLCAVKMKL